VTGLAATVVGPWTLPTGWPADIPATQLVVALPLLAALLGVIVVRRSNQLAAWAAIGLGSLTLAASGWQLVQVLRGFAEPVGAHPGTVGALPLGDVHVPLRLLADDLSALAAVVVALVALVVQVFTRWYLHRDPHYRAFSASVSLFTAAMLLVVQSGDLVLTLVGWEVMGWCSYLLIGHESTRASANRAAFKAFMVTRIADLAWIIGLIILIVGAGTSSIPEVITHWTSSDADGATLTAALLCLVSGIAGKSAQFPFHDWLPDAMEGPTPASALIHAATMVAAGTIVVSRLFPLFAESDVARLVLGLVAAVSTVGAALLAFAQPDLKRLLAWSTISQVGIMLGVLAVVPADGNPGVGVLHFASHAMFKALLFLALGWLSVLVGGTAVTQMKGGLRHYPAISRSLGIGFLALAGVPPFVGFVSKEMVLSTAEHAALGSAAGLTGWLVLVGVGASVPLTAAYCMRAWLILMHRTREERQVHRQVVRESRRVHEVHILDMFAEQVVTEEEHGHDSGIGVISDSALTGIRVLALLSVVGGALIFTPLLSVDIDGVNGYFVAGSLVLMAVAALVVRVMSLRTVRSDAAERLGRAVIRGSAQGVGFDAAYQLLVARPVTWLAHAVVWLDRDVIDAYVRGSAATTRLAGRLLERTHTRRPSPNLVWVLLGMVGVAVAGVRLW
jgi:NADH-quinone oxidoreductase subunit L